ncbi:MAG: hypothetical protein LBN40_05565 [Oscillospiraceae bacterium]|jgi:hypothetical protein|nr:hypothetical protein [Oscillospiraceae bacterium]
MLKKLTPAAFVALLFIIPTLSFVFMPDEFLENENRYRGQLPKLTLSSYKDETFMTRFTKWYGDILFGRTELIRFKNSVERFSGKTETGGVFDTGERLAQIWRDPDMRFADKNIDAVNTFAAQTSTPVYVILAPTSQEIYKDELPKHAEVTSQLDYIDYCYDKLSGATAVGVADTLLASKQDYIYYRTDHHWTSLGAYLAYRDFAQQAGFVPTPIEQLNAETAARDFRGTLYSKNLDTSIEPDEIDFYFADNEPPLSLAAKDGDTNATADSLYFREFLSEKDKYAAFLGQNAPLLEIDTGYTGGKLLLIKDSYANAFVPFVTRNFSHITVADPRYFNLDYRLLFNPDDYDAVLFLYNVVSFSDDTGIIKLK